MFEKESFQLLRPVQSTEIPRNDIKKTRPIRIGFFVAEKQGFVLQRRGKTKFWERSVQLAVTGFGNVVAPCRARKSLETASKNPTYSDRVFCGGEAGIWTLATIHSYYSLSRGAPSASWVLLHCRIIISKPWYNITPFCVLSMILSTKQAAGLLHIAHHSPIFCWIKKKRIKFAKQRAKRHATKQAI